MSIRDTAAIHGEPAPRLQLEIAELLASPLILRGENADLYRARLRAMAKSIGATNVLHWLWANDVAYHSWQIIRLHNIETWLILGHQIQMVEELLASTFDPPESEL